MHRTPIDQLLIGAHTSIAGGVHHALIEGKSIGATTIQLFTSNQRQWKSKTISEEEALLFREIQEETKIQKVMSHSSYLINLGSSNPENLLKSREAFREEIIRSSALGLSFINFHPGASVGDTKEACLDRIVKSLLMMEEYVEDGQVRLLLESTAGQGSSIGYQFEELAYILERTQAKLPMGICLDTCHLFCAGYDIRTPQDWKRTLEEFDKIIGIQHLYAFHVNDSEKECGSRKDRHASLGEGKIGLESFKFLMSYSVTREIPKYLETPGGCPMWDKEIWMLREFGKNYTR